MRYTIFFPEVAYFNYQEHMGGFEGCWVISFSFYDFSVCFWILIRKLETIMQLTYNSLERFLGKSLISIKRLIKE